MISTQKGKSVFIVEQGKATSVPVQTGISDGRWIEITSGLRGDEDIVVVGKRKLLEGTPVRVSPFNLPEATLSKQKFERRGPGGPPPRSTAETSSPSTQKK